MANSPTDSPSRTQACFLRRTPERKSQEKASLQLGSTFPHQKKKRKSITLSLSKKVSDEVSRDISKKSGKANFAR